jgi:hypothetical protein
LVGANFSSILFLHAAPNEVYFNDFLGSLFEDGILGKRDGRLVVDLEHDLLGFIVAELG